MSKTSICVLSALLLLGVATPSFAQQLSNDPAVLDRQQKKKDAEEIDRRYKATLKSTDHGAAAARVDPWQNMRGPDESKTKR